MKAFTLTTLDDLTEIFLIPSITIGNKKSSLMPMKHFMPKIHSILDNAIVILGKVVLPRPSQDDLVFNV